MKATGIVFTMIISAAAFCVAVSTSYNAFVAPVTIHKSVNELQNEIKTAIQNIAETTDKYSDITDTAIMLDAKYSGVFTEIKTEINAAERIDYLEDAEKRLVSTIYEIINLVEYSAETERLNAYSAEIKEQTENLLRLKQKYNQAAVLYNKRVAGKTNLQQNLMLFTTSMKGELICL